MLWAKILKIEQKRKSHNGGLYQTVYFRTFDNETKKNKLGKNGFGSGI
jgi:hypothetical protein